MRRKKKLDGDHLKMRPSSGREERNQLLKPNPGQQEYIDVLKNHGSFDAEYYLANFEVPRACRSHALEHFVIFGERNGHCPNKDFNPTSYSTCNPDVAAAGSPAYLHFILRGEEEGRQIRELPTEEASLDLNLIPPLYRVRACDPKHDIAITVHVFYYSLWDEIRDSINKLDRSFDLFVNLIERDGVDEAEEMIRKDFPDAFIFRFPNFGRDIFPFLHLINGGCFDRHKAVCKLHTKKSPHREDGDAWRAHLIGSLFQDSAKANQLLEAFLEDDSLGIIVADGQIFSDDKWWGINQQRTFDTLKTVGIECHRWEFTFPAGSIYWVKPEIIDTLKGLMLDEYHFEEEQKQLDGTAAHVIERAIGYIAQSGYQKIKQVTEVFESIEKDDKSVGTVEKPEKPPVFAFYLPQFHPIEENDQWWGKGFTEWSNVSKATPKYHYHYQPRVPESFGHYDLRLTEVMQNQATAAQEAGIDAFCVYYYWFNGKRLLQTPIDNVLKDKEVDFPFFFCWANESWTRAWDGHSNNSLIEQNYEDGFEERFADDLIPYVMDERYHRSGERPIVLIYRPMDLPDPVVSIGKIRERLAEKTNLDFKIGGCFFHGKGHDPTPIADALDFIVEVPPHALVKPKNYYVGGEKPIGNSIVLSHRFQGAIYDYHKVIKNSRKAKHIPREIRDKVARGIMLNWDNSARRGRQAHISFGCNPGSFSFWLRQLLNDNPTMMEHGIFINAWNEWAEGTYLEPDSQYGDAYLRALKKQLM